MTQTPSLHPLQADTLDWVTDVATRAIAADSRAVIEMPASTILALVEEVEDLKDQLWLREAELGLVGDPALVGVENKGERVSMFEVVNVAPRKFVPPDKPTLRARRLAWEDALDHGSRGT